MIVSQTLIKKIIFVCFAKMVEGPGYFFIKNYDISIIA
jgi:hypothetical protein